MKAIIFAAFAAMSLGAGSAYADAGESYDWSKPASVASAQDSTLQQMATNSSAGDMVIAFTDVTTSGSGAARPQYGLMKPAQPDASNSGNPINWGSG